MVTSKKGKKAKKEKPIEQEETRDSVLEKSVSQTGLSRASRATYVEQLQTSLEDEKQARLALEAEIEELKL